MSDPIFTDEDLKQSEHYEVLGPAYFAARRIAEALMQGAEAEPLKKVADKVIDRVKTEVYEYVEWNLRSDLESNLQSHIVQFVDGTVEALLTGTEWAMKRYPFAQYQRGESIRAAVAKHGGEPLLMARIADLEKEIARLTESLKWARRD
jgi:hypothetical protein